MAVYFLYMKTFGRINGSSAPGAAAYRAGERIKDERTGKTYDHSSRQDVMHKEIVLPSKLADLDMSWAQDRASLWNAAEAAETRRNARIAREFLVALPVELPAQHRLALVREFSRDLAERYGFAVDVAIHAPRTDPRNHHAHLLATTREINSSGFGEKTTLELHDARRSEHGLAPFYCEVIALRERWANVTNAALHAARIDARVDHRSLQTQGIDREPRPQLPRAIYEMERRGEYTIIGERMREEHHARVEARLAHGEAREPQANGEPQSAERPKTMAEIRRQAREDWLRMRAERGAAPAIDPRALPTPDDDFTR